MDAPPARKWYIAVLIVAARVEGQDESEPLVDVQHKLLRAEDAESAYQRALEMGANEELDYDNEEGETIRWRFIGLHDLRELSEAPADGSEVYSWLDRTDPAELIVEKDWLPVFTTNNNPA